MTCKTCGSMMKHRDYVKRNVKTAGGATRWIRVQRLICTTCGEVHRELPGYLLPYKHYEKGIIQGVINGQITSKDIEYEDYPCEMTMLRTP